MLVSSPISSVRDSFPLTLIQKIQYNQSVLMSWMKDTPFTVFTFTSLIRSQFVSLFICVFFFLKGGERIVYLADFVGLCDFLFFFRIFALIPSWTNHSLSKRVFSSGEGKQ